MANKRGLPFRDKITPTSFSPSTDYPCADGGAKRGGGEREGRGARSQKHSFDTIYTVLVVPTYVHTRYYTGDIGGMAGILLGLSILTLYEELRKAALNFLHALSKRKKTKSLTDKMTKLRCEFWTQCAGRCIITKQLDFQCRLIQL